MNSLTFITGNYNKLLEAKYILGETLEQLNIDVEEIQDTDGKKVSEYKMIKFIYDNDKFNRYPIFCEDTSLEIENMNGFPGALVKFYYSSLGDNKVVKFNGGSKAKMISWIVYSHNNSIKMLKGETEGTIPTTPMTGNYGFGFDAVFVPDGSTKSLAQMPPEEKMKYSARYKALIELKKYLKV
jgi:XTP/dITP diphosphohydrolase